jgi:hypothetical protein
MAASSTTRPWLFPIVLVATVAVLFSGSVGPGLVFAFRDSLHFYPPQILLVMLLPDGTSLNVYCILHLALAATGAYLLARDQGCSRPAAIVAGHYAAIYSLADSWHPDWHVTVSTDGGPPRAEPIRRANRIHRALSLPAGRHVLEFRHHSRTFVWTWPVTLTAWVVAAGVFGGLRFRRACS